MTLLDRDLLLILMESGGATVAERTREVCTFKDLCPMQVTEKFVHP